MDSPAPSMTVVEQLSGQDITDSKELYYEAEKEIIPGDDKQWLFDIEKHTAFSNFDKQATPD